jgi:hypothetical protein
VLEAGGMHHATREIFFKEVLRLSCPRFSFPYWERTMLTDRYSPSNEWISYAGLVVYKKDEDRKKDEIDERRANLEVLVTSDAGTAGFQNSCSPLTILNQHHHLLLFTFDAR